MSQETYMKHFFAFILLLCAACSNVDSDSTASANSGLAETLYSSPEETLYMKWDGKEFFLDNGDSFQMNEKHLIRDKYPDAKAINLTLVKSGLTDSLPVVIAQFNAIGFPDVTTIESAVLYRDKQTKSPVGNRLRPLNIYLTDVITISDKTYNYNEMDSFIDQITLFDPRLFSVVINLRDSDDLNLERIVDVIEGLGFKTYIELNVAQ